MNRLKNNLSFIILILVFFFAGTKWLFAQTVERNAIKINNVSMPADGEAQIQPGQAEEQQLTVTADEIAPAAVITTAGGKSILNTSRAQDNYAVRSPRALQEVVTVRTPKPIENLVKEVPREIAAKKAKLKNAGIQDKSAKFGKSAVVKIVAVPECIIFYAVESKDTPANQTFKISNGGSGVLNYTLSEDIPWLSLDKASGSFTTGQDTVTASVNISGLSLSQSPYVGDIIITNSDDPAQKKIVKARISIVSPETYAKTYSYDQNGNLVRRVTPNGDIIEYEYDAVNRLVKIYYLDGSSVSYTYDKNGNRVSMADKTGTTDFIYDIYNRLIAVYFPNINPVIYTYDKDGNIVKIEYPDHSLINYTYNPDNKLITVADPTGATSYTYYTDTGLLKTKALPNSVVTTYIYDTAKRITDVDNRGPAEALISTYHYIYDPNGNITSTRETTSSGVKTTTYEYDKLNRLTKAVYQDERGTVTYEYDPAGNRAKMVTPLGTTKYKYDKDNRLLRAGNEIFFYDKSGNLIKKISPSKTATYAYDYDNRLIRYADDVNTVEYEYDGDGRRVAKIVNNARTNYVNDILRNPFQVIMEANYSWYVTKIYRYGLDRLSQEEM